MRQRSCLPLTEPVPGAKQNIYRENGISYIDGTANRIITFSGKCRKTSASPFNAMRSIASAARATGAQCTSPKRSNPPLAYRLPRQICLRFWASLCACSPQPVIPGFPGSVRENNRSLYTPPQERRQAARISRDPAARLRAGSAARRQRRKTHGGALPNGPRVLRSSAGRRNVPDESAVRRRRARNRGPSRRLRESRRREPPMR